MKRWSHGRFKHLPEALRKHSFRQIRICPKDIEITAFKTKYGHSEIFLMSIGLSILRRPSSLQWTPNSTTSYIISWLCTSTILLSTKLYTSVITPLGDNTIPSESTWPVWRKSEWKLMTNNPSLILQVQHNGVSPWAGGRTIVKEWPIPQNLTELRIFLGLLQFIRQFMKYFSRIVAALIDHIWEGAGTHKWDERGFEALEKM